jgi:hypothetical protein
MTGMLKAVEYKEAKSRGFYIDLVYFNWMEVYIHEAKTHLSRLQAGRRCKLQQKSRPEGGLLILQNSHFKRLRVLPRRAERAHRSCHHRLMAPSIP